MFTRLQHAATIMIWRAVDEIRHHPDRGDESVNKILWAGVIVAVVAIVGGIFRDTIVAAFNSLVITLGFTP
jgi:hypothetical protein